MNYSVLISTKVFGYPADVKSFSILSPLPYHTIPTISIDGKWYEIKDVTYDHSDTSSPIIVHVRVKLVQ